MEESEKPKPLFRHWYLTELKSSMGGLKRTLPVFFHHSHLLRVCHRQVRKSEEKELARFKSERITDKQRVLIRSLLAIRRACFIALRTGFKDDFEKLKVSRFSWILSCPPSGGFWEGTGKRIYCRNLLCPWCWMRRHDLVRRGLVDAAGRRISIAGRSIVAVGMSERLHCLSFRAAGAGFFDSPAHFNELKRQADLEVLPFRKGRRILRVCYPMPDLNGATVAFMSDRPFESMSTGKLPFTSLPGGEMGVHVTEKPLAFSRLLASRMLWVPEMLHDPDRAVKVCEVFRGRNLFNLSGGQDAQTVRGLPAGGERAEEQSS